MGDLFAPSHILLIIIVALLLFGPKKLPELGRAFGKMLKEFKAGVQGVMSDDDKNERENQPVHQLEQKKEEPKETKRLPD